MAADGPAQATRALDRGPAPAPVVPGERQKASRLTGLLVVRGAGAPVVQLRLPRRSSATVGRRERHAVELLPEWVPADLAVFTPVPDGWLVTNGARVPMRVETDWVQSGAAVFLPHALVMLQRGDHRLSWPALGGPGTRDSLSVSVAVRMRRMEDQRLRYAVDSVVDSASRGVGSYLGVQEAPMSASLRYRLAVLFRHLIEGEPEPVHLLRRRAQFLGLTEDELETLGHRLRRRLNVVRDLDLATLADLGDYLVGDTGELTRADLDP